uniref:Si:ch211-266i6.3 n=1 Tax=Oncorhynchus mykiss TaxID=8022 RepID=A0A8C7THK8_ONCMY
MDTVTRKNTNFKKVIGTTKPFITRAAPTKTVAAPSAPLHSKSNKKDDLGKGEDALKKVKMATAGDTKRRNTFSQTLLTKQAVRQRKLVAEASEPATVPAKPVPGTYKGKVVQSKISSFRKPSGLEGGVESKAATKTSAPKAESQRPGNLTKIRPKAVDDLPQRSMFKPPQICQPSKSKSVSNGPPPVSKCPATCRPTGFCSAVPPARMALLTTALQSSSRSAMTSKGKELPQRTKPKMTTDKVRKPLVASTLSQYRATTETAEEKRAKLAEWLASKGKTLKRPPISAPHFSDQTSQQPGPEPEPTVRPKNDQVVPEQEAACASTPLIMNTTLDLLDNSDTYFLPIDPEVQMNDVRNILCLVIYFFGTVIFFIKILKYNLTTTPHEKKESEEKIVEAETNYGFEERNEFAENNFDRSEEVKSEVGEGASEQKVRKGYIEEVDSDYDDECLMETTPEGASIVKYNLKTTPYLQSVKRTINTEACASGSKRKNTIKDLKFLTPVRRSCRIQRKSSHLPGMLTDHDTCVSSLAELVNLDDDASAYIYRRNPALLEDLPDHPKDLERI